ncbi:MAG TPA: methylated-DNA--[protein]-cysteine S-methyltransferase [Lysobacter sp.]|nr:methylated-DNA--[protein]-cysteine S-methyltransferase [Lysobacter sp.]
MDQEILFSTGECVLGMMLVAKSERGVCAILLGDDAVAPGRDLQQRFPQARLREAGVEFEPLLSKVAGFLAASARGLDVPLDMQGTPFQKQVWSALREIPAGSTETYAEVARRIGAPQDAKEVGEACAANALAVAIPCHRVVRKDGGLGGYRWGVERKRALLRREGAQEAGTADLFEPTRA